MTSKFLPISVYVDGQELAAVERSGVGTVSTVALQLLDPITISTTSKVVVEVDQYWGLGADLFLWQLNSIAEALTTKGLNDLTLFVPYLPASNVDASEELFVASPIKTFLNSLHENYLNVVTYDACPTVEVELFGAKRSVMSIQMPECIGRLNGLMNVDQYDVVISPDRTIETKVKAVADFYNKLFIGLDVYKEIKHSEDVFRVDTLVDLGYINGKSLLICYDILSDSELLNHLVSTLKENGAKEIGVYATHLIGKPHISKSIDFIYIVNEVIGKQ